MKLLDLFCCEGGAAKGYQQAGFEVTGIDLHPRFAKRYPGTFIQADALEYVKEHGHEYDVIHASPPCQRYSITNAARRHDYPDLVADTRTALEATGKPWVIENVVGAPLNDPITLCWTMFHQPGSVHDTDGEPLQMFRHRLFESNIPIAPPSTCNHDKTMQVAGSYGGARRNKWEARHVRKGGYVPAKNVQEQLLGIDWMTQHGLYQSLPPSYTEWVGSFLATAVKGQVLSRD